MIPKPFEQTIREQDERAKAKAELEAQQDQDGGYVVVQDILPNLVEGELNRMYRRGWRFISNFRGHGGESLVFFKSPA